MVLVKAPHGGYDGTHGIRVKVRESREGPGEVWLRGRS